MALVELISNYYKEIIMIKTELVTKIAEIAGLKKTDSEKALDAFISVVTDALKEGEEVKLIGFGTFGTTKRNATTGRNPKTKEPITIPARIVPKFKPGQRLKDALLK
jgi:DNA-binding protein HU-beta